jgi:hypothetical protein
MAAHPTEVTLCAEFLRSGVTTPERVAAFLNDADASELAKQLAERRGPVGLPAASEGRARVTNILARALALRLTDPDQLRVTLAAADGAEEMITLAVALARKRLRASPSYRPIEEWEQDPSDRRTVPATVAPMEAFCSRLALAEVEARPRADLIACGRGVHTYGEVDPTSGWSTCLSCGHVLVADRRFGPGSLLPGESGSAPPPPNRRP